MGYGFRGFIGIAPETTWGTPVSPAKYLETLSENVTVNYDRFTYRNIDNKISMQSDAAGIMRVDGNISLAAFPDSVLYALRGSYNTVSTSVVLSGFLFEHNLYINTTDFSTNAAAKPYTLQIFRDTSQMFIYSGATFSKVEFNYTPNQDVRMSLDVIGKAGTLGAYSSPTFTTSPSKPFDFSTTEIKIDTVASTILNNINVSIDNNLNAVTTINNSNKIERIKRQGPQMIRVTGTMEFDDKAQYTKFINETETRVEITSTLASSYKLYANFPKLIFTSFPTQTQGRDRLLIDFEAKARYSSSDGYAALFKLTNTSTL